MAQFIDKGITYWNMQAYILVKKKKKEKLDWLSDTSGSPCSVIIGIHDAVHSNLSFLYVQQPVWCKPGKHSITLPSQSEVDAGAGW